VKQCRKARGAFSCIYLG